MHKEFTISYKSNQQMCPTVSTLEIGTIFNCGADFWYIKTVGGFVCLNKGTFFGDSEPYEAHIIVKPGDSLKFSL